MLNTAFPSDALDVALNDARRDDSAGVIGSKQGTNKDIKDITDDDNALCDKWNF